MSAPLRVVHAVLSLDFGGLERVVLDLVRQGRRSGQYVSVLCMSRRGTLAGEVEACGARVVCLNKPEGLTPGLIRPARALLQDLRADVVHTHQVGALLYSGPAALAGGARLLVHTEHTNQLALSTSFNRRLRARVHWQVAGRMAARFFCVSDDIAAAARGIVPAGKLHVVRNGIDLAAFADRAGAAEVRQALGVPTGAPLVGTVGRLNEVKRQDLLIRAFARVRAAVPAAHLLLVGDGPLGADLRALSVQLGVGAVVHFAGYQSRPERFLGATDVFALTSRHEGMPLAILEAWAAGLPVVASRVGGVPGLVSDGETGLLFDPGDEAALAASLVELLRDRDRASRLARAGRSRVAQEYDSRRMLETYHRHYLDLLPATPAAETSTAALATA
jgi:glycosyltransferase involved in cell wall biosynthesis